MTAIKPIILNKLTTSLRQIHTTFALNFMPNPSAELPGSTVDSADIKRHAKLADQWWDPHGPMKALHSMNQIR